MKKNPLKDEAATHLAAGHDAVTRKRVQERAAELAVLNGRPATAASKSDEAQAERELAGGSEADSNDTVLESVPESARWDPVPGSKGHKVLAAPSEDEDEEGRGDPERLVAEGVDGAAEDQMLRATKAAAEKNL